MYLGDEHNFSAGLYLLFLLPSLAFGINLDCKHVRVETTDFDLSELGGPRSVLHSVDQGLSFKNTTFTIDICKGLQRKKDVPREHQCPDGTRGGFGMKQLRDLLT